jgi:hypothetical protein
MKRLTVLLCVLSGSAFLAACGGSGSSSTSGDSTSRGTFETKAPTKAEYIARADALCEKEAPRVKARLRRGEERVEESGGGTATEERVGAKVLHEEAAAAAEELAALKRIRPPARDAALIGSIVRHGEELARRSDEIATAIEEGEIRVGEALLTELEKQDVITKHLEHGYGFKVCGQVGLSPIPGTVGTASIG